MKKTCILLFSLFAFFLTGCGEKNINVSGIYFDTIVNVNIYGCSDEGIKQEVEELLNKYENMLSKTKEGSDVFNINSENKGPVTVDRETMFLLKKGEEYWELSEGKFDITVYPVTKLWDFHEGNSVPPEEDIKEALKHTGFDKFQIDEEKCEITKNDIYSGVDLGGLAKGYIADKIKEFLVERKVKSALINLGGNVVALGKKQDGSEFKIGIKKPFTEEILEVVKVEDRSVTTSGVYERYFYNNGRLYHHILEPADGYPVNSDVLGVTVINKDSMEGDFIGTACLLMGYEKAVEWVKKFPETEVIFVNLNNEVLK